MTTAVVREFLPFRFDQFCSPCYLTKGVSAIPPLDNNYYFIENFILDDPFTEHSLIIYSRILVV